LFAEMEHGKAAELGGRSEVYAHRALPASDPLVVRIIDRIRLEDAGIVDEHVDTAAEPLQRLAPQGFGRARLRQIGSDATIAPGRAVADDLMAFERRDDGFADAPA